MSFKRNSLFIGTGIILTAGIIACGNKEHHSSSYSSPYEATAEEKRASFERLMTEVELATVPIHHFDNDASIVGKTTGNKTALELHELITDKKNSGTCIKKTFSNSQSDFSIGHDANNDIEFCPFYYQRLVNNSDKDKAHNVSVQQESKTPDFRKKTGILEMHSSTTIPRPYFFSNPGPHELEIPFSWIYEMVDPNNLNIKNSINFKGNIKVSGHSAEAKVSSDLFLKFSFTEYKPTGEYYKFFDVEFKALFTNEGARGNREITHPSCTLSGEAISTDKCQRYLTQIIALLHIKDLI
jgi:hypothetical protein